MIWSKIQMQKMTFNRAFASILYLPWVVGYWAIVLNGGWMTGFGPGRTTRPAYPILEQGVTVVFEIWVVLLSFLPLISL